MAPTISSGLRCRPPVVGLAYQNPNGTLGNFIFTPVPVSAAGPGRCPLAVWHQAA
jgi:hypothetical protein